MAQNPPSQLQQKEIFLSKEKEHKTTEVNYTET